MSDENDISGGGGSNPQDAGGGSTGLTDEKRREYWKKNLTVIGILMGIWAFVPLVLGILLGPTLNEIGSIGGYPLGFFVAQQGSIYVFLALIFFYAWYMNRLDRQFGVEED
ncbi:solute symporter associated protein [Halorhodospira halochloris]|uniref:Solute symporter associated protein n=1 Tax=Halorhodospira halochloris TaxID=1052 RepID=A0A110B525_HALHR|nr:DUF4212 domain-containing protein [Halorhodospira halochloris]MBK1651354.1 hypothetical protein [Halorhodospira halochloris]BAU57640.1 solute symporter associated protein [Halorhodospira halochloris]